MSYIDTRDLDSRRDELKDDIEEYLASSGDFSDQIRDAEEEIEEIDTIEGYCPDFYYGETLIPVDEFEEYAQQFAEDIGAIGDDNQWPLYCIDWERAASDLAMDYTEVEYQGESYYVR